MTISSEPFRNLQKALTEYTAHAKSVNVHAIAISAIIKKLLLLNFFQTKKFSENHLQCVNYIDISLETRYNRLLDDLEIQWSRVVSVDLANELERLLGGMVIQARNEEEGDDRESVESYTKLIINRIDELRYIDVRESVIEIRSQCSQFSTLRKISDILENGLEQKLSLPVIKSDSS